MMRFMTKFPPKWQVVWHLNDSHCSDQKDNILDNLNDNFYALLNDSPNDVIYDNLPDPFVSKNVTWKWTINSWNISSINHWKFDNTLDIQNDTFNYN